MSKKYRLCLLAAFAVFVSADSFAQEPKFLFPVSCTYGVDCWPVNYVDVDPSEGVATDFKCKRKTYDAHQGTDFALASVSKMREGVDVLAAAAGQVLRVRNGEADTYKEQNELDAIRIFTIFIISRLSIS